MDFLGIGLPELVVIMVLTLIVMGPKRLPEAAAQIARTIRELRQYSASMTRELTDAVKDLEREYDELKGEWKEAGKEIRQSTETISGELTSTAEDARRGLDLEASDPEDTSKPTPSPQSHEST